VSGDSRLGDENARRRATTEILRVAQNDATGAETVLCNGLESWEYAAELGRGGLRRFGE